MVRFTERMKLDSDTLEIQKLYPRIYHACHADHVRAASNEARLSARDASILAHLDDDGGTRQAALAKHLGVTAATLSEALAKLVSLGYVDSRADEEDERRNRLRLTAKGAQALQQASVLDTRKLKQLMGRLTPEERARAVEGLGLLARAALQEDR